MKQFFPSKSVDHEESSVHYNSSEINCLRSKEVATVLQSQSAGISSPVYIYFNERYIFQKKDGICIQIK